MSTVPRHASRRIESRHSSSSTLADSTDRRHTFLDSLAVQARRAGRHYSRTLEPMGVRAARALVADFLAQRRDLLEQAARTAEPAGTTPASVYAGRVFTYWDGPEHDAPVLVRACLRQLRAVHPDAIVLNASTWDDYADIPGIVVDRLRDRPAHFSDMLRVSLLELYGGVWADATAFVPRPLTGELEPYLDEGILYLRWSAKRISNWFIAAQPQSAFLVLQRAALEAWWREHDVLPDYFLYHRVFEVLLQMFPALRKSWARAPRLSTVPSHFLQIAMFSDYDPEEVEAILDASFVHKLSYKYDEADVTPDSILRRIIDGTLDIPSTRRTPLERLLSDW